MSPGTHGLWIQGDKTNLIVHSKRKGVHFHYTGEQGRKKGSFGLHKGARDKQRREGVLWSYLGFSWFFLVFPGSAGFSSFYPGFSTNWSPIHRNLHFSPTLPMEKPGHLLANAKATPLAKKGSFGLHKGARDKQRREGVLWIYLGFPWFFLVLLVFPRFTLVFPLIGHQYTGICTFSSSLPMEKPGHLLANAKATPLAKILATMEAWGIEEGGGGF